MKGNKEGKILTDFMLDDMAFSVMFFWNSSLLIRLKKPSRRPPLFLAFVTFEMLELSLEFRDSECTLSAVVEDL